MVVVAYYEREELVGLLDPVGLIVHVWTPAETGSLPPPCSALPTPPPGHPARPVPNGIDLI